MSRQLAGTAEDALNQLDAALQQPALEPGAKAQLLLARALTHLSGGRLLEVQRTAQALQRLAEGHGLATSRSWAHYLLGRVNYEWDRLDEAASHFGTVVDAPEGAASLPLHDSHLGLALIFEANGQSVAADELIEEIQERFWDRGAFFLPSIGSFQARLALVRGEMPQAHLVEQVAPAPEPISLMLMEIPLLTRTRLLIAQNTSASLQEALDALRALQRVSQSTHNKVRRAEILALRALVLEAQGETQTALEILRQALAVAEQTGQVRVFVDLGPSMAAQLYRLVMNGYDSGYARHLLAAFPRLSQPVLPVEEEATETMEPLTDREWEVLTLMGRRLSNKEIAQDLIISPHTVKKHASNIYQKLGVNSRRQAISRAHQLGLLPALVDGGPFPAFT
jgi:LuxR family maltose regulon positive regulatory protein